MTLAHRCSVRGQLSTHLPVIKWIPPCYGNSGATESGQALLEYVIMRLKSAKGHRTTFETIHA